MSTSGEPTGRRWTFRLGVLMVLVGLVLLGYVGWQMVVTNWISQREHSALVESTQEAWAATVPGGADGGADDGADDGADGEQADGASGDAPSEIVPGQVEVDGRTVLAVVRIPRFGEDFAVPLVEGVDADALAAGIGHFPGTAAPGRRGNFAIAGHRVTHGEPLRDLPDLEPGDEVVVETRDRVFTYRLDGPGDGLTVPFTQTWVVDPEPRNPDPDGVSPAPGERRLLTIATCAELFHTDDRLVVFGHLVSAVDRS